MGLTFSIAPASYPGFTRVQNKFFVDKIFNASTDSGDMCCIANIAYNRETKFLPADAVGWMLPLVIDKECIWIL